MNCFSGPGQYISPNKHPGEVPYLTGFKIVENSDSDIPDLIDTSIKLPKDNRDIDNNLYYTQGAYNQGDFTWLTITGQSVYENSTARLVTWQNGNTKGKRWRWPHGAEDLYYSPLQGKLWCQTEHPDKIRYFFSVDLNSYFSFE